MKSRLYRFFLRVFRRRLLRDVYLGILGREPDADGLAAYAAALRDTSRLDRVVKELAASPEAFRYALARHSTALAEQLGASLRHGVVNEEDLREWSAALRGGAPLSAVVSEIASGPTHWTKLIRQEPEHAVIIGFQSLLGREPDSVGLDTYRTLLEATGDLQRFLQELCASEEHVAIASRMATAHGLQPAPGEEPRLSREECVQAVYRGLLGRDAQADELAHGAPMLASPEGLRALVQHVVGTPEHRRRVLLRTP